MKKEEVKIEAEISLFKDEIEELINQARQEIIEEIEKRFIIDFESKNMDIRELNQIQGYNQAIKDIIKTLKQ